MCWMCPLLLNVSGGVRFCESDSWFAFINLFIIRAKESSSSYLNNIKESPSSQLSFFSFTSSSAF